SPPCPKAVLHTRRSPPHPPCRRQQTPSVSHRKNRPRDSQSSFGRPTPPRNLSFDSHLLRHRKKVSNRNTRIDGRPGSFVLPPLPNEAHDATHQTNTPCQTHGLKSPMESARRHRPRSWNRRRR